MKWLFFCLGVLCFHSNAKISPDSFYQKIDFEKNSTTDLSPFVNQSFSYLGEGAQMIAFLSEDQETVLKIFKAHHKKPFKFTRLLRHFSRTQQDRDRSEKKWEEKFYATCSRYEIAFQHLKEETGLVALHFQKTPQPLLTNLKAQSELTIDLSKLPFILQKKVTLAPEYFKKHPEKQLIGKEALKELFTARTKKGFSDSRQSLRINYGFIGDRAVQIDVGKLEPFTGDKDQEIQRLHARVEEWASGF